MDFGAMEWTGQHFVIAIIALSTAGWLINNWIRAKHGYALEDEFFGKTERADTQEIKQLREEKKQLRDKEFFFLQQQGNFKGI